MSDQGIAQYHMRPVVQVGPGAIAGIPTLFKGAGAGRVVLLSDAGLTAAGIVDKVAQVFAGESAADGVELAGIFTEITENSSCRSVDEAVRYAKGLDADGILAVGGGSVLDAAKGIKYCLHHGLDDMAEIMKDGLKLVAWPEAQPTGIAHVAVPTTAGTGAEVSAAAVFYNERNNLKCNLVAPFIEADFAVLDAELTLGLPPHLTASTGMDAMTHALEAICSPIATPLTDAHAFAAAQLIERALPIAVRNGQDLQARQTMLQASSMAINAFINALNAIPVHNCSHAFGGLYRVPHGEANCALLPIVMEAMPDYYRPQARRLAKGLNMDVEDKDDGAVLSKVIARLRAFQSEIGGSPDFARFGIATADVPKIVSAIESDPAGVFYAIPRESVQMIAERVIGR